MATEVTDYIVPEDVAGLRADKVLAEGFKDYSRSQIQAAFERKEVFLDGAPIKKNVSVTAGQTLQIILPEPEDTEIIPVDLPIDILYEDKDIIAVNKSPGVVVHPGAGTGDDTLVHRLLHYTEGKLSAAAGKRRPGVVHRLDKETSGVILFAKSDRAYLRLIEQFKERTLDKQYVALIHGKTRLLSGSVKESIGRNEKFRIKMAVTHRGKEAHTDWQVEDQIGDKFSLVRCWIHSGRTHQIRVHMSHIDHPLVGDNLYGYKHHPKFPEPPRVMLHAAKLTLTHPVTRDELTLEAPLPEDFSTYMRTLKSYV